MPDANGQLTADERAELQDTYASLRKDTGYLDQNPEVRDTLASLVKDGTLKDLSGSSLPPPMMMGTPAGTVPAAVAPAVAPTAPVPLTKIAPPPMVPAASLPADQVASYADAIKNPSALFSNPNQFAQLRKDFATGKLSASGINLGPVKTGPFAGQQALAGQFNSLLPNHEFQIVPEPDGRGGTTLRVKFANEESRAEFASAYPQFVQSDPDNFSSSTMAGGTTNGGRGGSTLENLLNRLSDVGNSFGTPITDAMTQGVDPAMRRVASPLLDAIGAHKEATDVALSGAYGATPRPSNALGGFAQGATDNAVPALGGNLGASLAGRAALSIGGRLAAGATAAEEAAPVAELGPWGLAGVALAGVLGFTGGDKLASMAQDAIDKRIYSPDTLAALRKASQSAQQANPAAYGAGALAIAFSGAHLDGGSLSAARDVAMAVKNGTPVAEALASPAGQILQNAVRHNVINGGVMAAVNAGMGKLRGGKVTPESIANDFLIGSLPLGGHDDGEGAGETAADKAFYDQQRTVYQRSVEQIGDRPFRNYEGSAANPNLPQIEGYSQTPPATAPPVTENPVVPDAGTIEHGQPEVTTRRATATSPAAVPENGNGVHTVGNGQGTSTLSDGRDNLGRTDIPKVARGGGGNSGATGLQPSSKGVGDSVALTPPAQQFATDYQSAMKAAGAKVTPEQAESVATVLDARAQAWAKQTGNPADEWFASRIAGLRGGDFSTVASDLAAPAAKTGTMAETPSAPSAGAESNVDTRTVGQSSGSRADAGGTANGAGVEPGRTHAAGAGNIQGAAVSKEGAADDAAQVAPHSDARNSVAPQGAPQQEYLHPDDIGIMPGIQYKRGVNAKGVTPILRGQTDYQTEHGGQITIYRDLDGKNFAVDGHHRVELAQRADTFTAPSANGGRVPAPRLIPANVLDAKDGWTPESAKAVGVLKNLRENKGTAIDAADALASIHDTAQARKVAAELPPSALTRDTKGLVHLDESGRSLVRNKTISESVAAAIGETIPGDRERQHIAFEQAQQSPDIRSYEDAQAMARRVADEPIVKRTDAGAANGDLFGDDPDHAAFKYQSTAGKQAAIEGRVRASLKSEKSALLNPTNAELREGEVIDAEGRKADAAKLGDAASKADALFAYDPEVKAALRQTAADVLNGKIGQKEGEARVKEVVMARGGRSVAEIVKGASGGGAVAEPNGGGLFSGGEQGGTLFQDEKGDALTPEQHAIRQAKDTPADILRIYDQLKTGEKPSQKFLNWQPVRQAEAERTLRETGIDVTGMVHKIDVDKISHIIGSHGEGNENRVGHIGITRSDFERLPDVVNNPDKISRSANETSGKMPAIVYQKRINGHIFYVEEVREGNHKLAAATMWKIAATGANPGEPRATAESDSAGVANTSETPPSPNSSIPDEKLLSQKGQRTGNLTQGQVEFLADKRAVVTFFKRANVSTALHEAGHIFRRDLYREQYEANGNGTIGNGFTDADRAHVEEWAGVKDRAAWQEGRSAEANRDAEEKFARGFEQYARDGEAPTPQLKKVFEAFKQWLTAIYAKVKGSPLDVPLSPQMRDIFDRMLGGEGTIEHGANEITDTPTSAVTGGEGEIGQRGTGGNLSPSGTRVTSKSTEAEGRGEKSSPQSGIDRGGASESGVRTAPAEYAGSINTTKLPAEQVAGVTADADRLGLNDKPSQTMEGIRQSARTKGLSVDDLRGQPLGKPVKSWSGTSSEYTSRLRDLHVAAKQAQIAADKVAEADPTEANKAEAVKAAADSDLVTLHRDADANQWGLAGNVHKTTAEPFLGVGAAIRADDVISGPKGQDAATVRRGVNPRAKAYNEKPRQFANFDKSRLLADLAKLKQEGDEEEADGGGVLNQTTRQTDTPEFQRWSGDAPVVDWTHDLTTHTRRDEVGMAKVKLEKEQEWLALSKSEGEFVASNVDRLWNAWKKIAKDPANPTEAEKEEAEWDYGIPKSYMVGSSDELEPLRGKVRREYKSHVEAARSAQSLIESGDYPIPKTGDPIVLTGYHGSEKSGFTAFSKRSLGKNTGAPSARQGFFVTAGPHTAESYAGYGNKAGTYRLYAKMSNPLVYDFRDTGYRETSYNDLINQAKRDGRDGVIFLNTKDPGEHAVPNGNYKDNVAVVFDPKQLKSAIGNNGNFDPTDANILHQSAPPNAFHERLAQLGAWHIEGGNRAYEPWKKAMLEDAKATGLNLTEGDLQTAYANARTYLEDQIVGAGGTRTARTSLVEQLGPVLGKEGTADFVNALHELPNGADIFDRFAQGGGASLTVDERGAVTRTYLDTLNAKNANKSAAAKQNRVGAMADLLQMAGEVRKAEATQRLAAARQRRAANRAAAAKAQGLAAQANPATTPQTPEQLFDAATLNRYGSKKAADAFHATLDPATRRNLISGTELTDADRAGILAAHRAALATRTPGTPLPANAPNEAVRAIVADANKAAAKARLQAAAAARRAAKQAASVPPPPPTPLDTYTASLASRFGGKKGAEAFRAAVGDDILGKVLNGDERTAAEEKALTDAYFDHLPKNAAKPLSPFLSANKTLAEAQRAARQKMEADRIAGLSPKQRAKEQVLKLAPVGKDGVPDEDWLGRLNTDLAKVDDADTRGIANVVSRYSATTIKNMVTAYRAGLLSGTQTLGKIGLSHMLYMAAEEAKRAPAAVADATMSKMFHTERTVEGVNLGAVGRSVREAGTTGLRQSGQILRGGEGSLILGGHSPLHAPGAPIPSEFSLADNRGGAVINPIVRASLRTHGAFFHVMGTGAFERGLNEWAHLEARRQVEADQPGLTGAAYRSAVVAKSAELRIDPTEDGLNFARNQAAETLFTNDNKGSGAMKAVRDFIGKMDTEAAAAAKADQERTGKGTGRAAQFAPAYDYVASRVAPFTKVPGNVAGKGLEYTAGAPYAVLRALKAGITHEQITPENQRIWANTFGRGVTGAAAMALGLAIVKGLIPSVGINPPDEKQHEYGSITAFGRDWQAGQLMPVMAPVFAGAYAKQSQDAHHSTSAIPAPADLIAGVTRASVNSLTENPYLRSSTTLSGIADMLSGKDDGAGKGRQFAASMAGGVVPIPTLLSEAAAQFDPQHVVRSKNDAGKKASETPFLDYLLNTQRNRIPGLRPTLAPQTDKSGNTIPESGGLLPILPSTPAKPRPRQ